MDNHETHVSIQAITKAKENGIVLLTIPPHTSHKLQPLDMGVLALLNRITILFVRTGARHIQQNQSQFMKSVI